MRRTGWLLALAVGCEGGTTEEVAPDAAPPPRPPATSPWRTEVVAPGGVGLQPALARSPEGALALAFYAARGVPDGPCVGLDAGEQIRWPILVARRADAGWTVEPVAAPIALGDPTGLALAFDPDGDLVLALPTGEPAVMARYCGAHDLAVARASTGFTPEVVVRESADAATGDAASDFGTVVGYWPALAFAPDGAAALAWKDVHAGSIQRDDRARADLEVARSDGAGWRLAPVDAGRGAGDHTAAAFDPAGRLVLADEIPVDEADDRLGLWVRRALDDGFEAVRLWPLPTGGRPGLAFDAEGALLVAFHDAEAGRPMLARLADGAALTDPAAWQLEAVGDPRYREGEGAQVAVSPQGFVTMAWRRCGRVGDAACSSQHDATIFAWQADGAWTREVVEAGGDGPCGFDPQLGFDAGGQAVVAWRCSRPAGDAFDFVVEAGVRAVLR
ncbi:MAG: hypothetical protein H6706_02520 [Myxococcales bacterium]|nr:hypothetical protein [Myxococcales bacterium]